MHLIPPPKMKAFEEIYAQHFRSVYNYVCFRVGNSTDAEDLTAEIFIRAYEYMDSFDGGKGAMRSWLAGISRNVVNTFFKKKAQQPQTAEFEEFLCADTDIEGDFLRREDIRQLLSHVRALPPGHRELLAMKYYLRLTNREIAKAAGISESNVAVTIFRIIGRLRKKMAA